MTNKERVNRGEYGLVLRYHVCVCLFRRFHRALSVQEISGDCTPVMIYDLLTAPMNRGHKEKVSLSNRENIFLQPFLFIKFKNIYITKNVPKNENYFFSALQYCKIFMYLDKDDISLVFC